MTMMADLTGKRVGMLQVMWTAGHSGQQRKVFWMTQCDCGTFKAISAQSLMHELVKSCGCAMATGKVPKINGPHGIKRRLHGNAVHGKRTPEYIAFINARQRCNNPKDRRYATYGARGIKFLFATFAEFLAEIGPRPVGMVIDRKNNDGNYEKGNLKWSTRKESALNTTRSKERQG